MSPAVEPGNRNVISPGRDGHFVRLDERPDTERWPSEAKPGLVCYRFSGLDFGLAVQPEVDADRRRILLSVELDQVGSDGGRRGESRPV